MYILCLFEAVYISHDLSLEKKGLECVRFALIKVHLISGSGSGIRYSGYGAFLILDPGSRIGFFPDLGSRMPDPGSQTHIFESW